MSTCRLTDWQPGLGLLLKIHDNEKCMCKWHKTQTWGRASLVCTGTRVLCNYCDSCKWGNFSTGNLNMFLMNSHQRKSESS